MNFIINFEYRKKKGTKKETVARMMRQSGFEVDFDGLKLSFE